MTPTELHKLADVCAFYSRRENRDTALSVERGRVWIKCALALREVADDLATVKERTTRAELATLRAAAQKWAMYAFNKHGDSILYNGLADLGGVGPDGEGWISTKKPT